MDLAGSSASPEKNVTCDYQQPIRDCSALDGDNTFLANNKF
jgi:hypothetical protein